MKFKKLTRKRIKDLLPFFKAQNLHLANFSAGFLFMWNKYISPEYAIYGDTLILKERYVNNVYFHYPLCLSGDEYCEWQAISELEKYCRENKIRIHYTNVPKSRLASLVIRYGSDVHVANQRRWRDYLYYASDFKTYAGGNYSGQRNHVNKFKKSFPDYEFHVCEQSDACGVLAFFEEYESYQLAKGEFSATEEMKAAKEILPYLKDLGLLCGYLTVGGKIVAASIGERCGDMLIIHIEKALRDYPGAYPTVAQLFARMFADENVHYINREDDSGDLGLRKSKLNYLPVEIVDKYNLAIRRSIDALSKLPEIESERVILAPVPNGDAAQYARLARDTELNRFWGYDWRDDAKGKDVSDAWFLNSARKDFKKKEEMPLGIYLDGKLAGEVILFNFGFLSEAEIGIRLLPEYRGRGLAKESLSAYMRYGFSKLGLEKIEAKCYKENVASEKALLSAGMRRIGEDDTFYYFYKTAAM